MTLGQPLLLAGSLRRPVPTNHHYGNGNENGNGVHNNGYRPNLEQLNNGNGISDVSPSQPLTLRQRLSGTPSAVMQRIPSSSSSSSLLPNRGLLPSRTRSGRVITHDPVAVLVPPRPPFFVTMKQIPHQLRQRKDHRILASAA
jgi:hypothetical protein